MGITAVWVFPPPPQKKKPHSNPSTGIYSKGGGDHGFHTVAYKWKKEIYCHITGVYHNLISSPDK